MLASLNPGVVLVFTKTSFHRSPDRHRHFGSSTCVVQLVLHFCCLLVVWWFFVGILFFLEILMAGLVKLTFSDESSSEEGATADELKTLYTSLKNKLAYHVVRFYNAEIPLGIAGIVPRIWTRYRKFAGSHKK